MDWQGRSLRMGAAVIALAVVLRLWSTGIFDQAATALNNSGAASFLLYLETGRVIRPVPDETVLEETTPETAEPAQTEPVQVVFSEGDADLVYVRGTSTETIDVASLLDLPLDWDLTGDAPTVLILHTHATESYTRSAGETYIESSDFRTLDTDFNMVSIGERVAEILEAAGIHVVHAEDLHDYPNYTGGYTRSKATALAYMEEYPSIRLVLDLHRDAALNEDGSQYATSAQADGQASAQIMFLMSTGHEHWRENMALAAKLAVWLENTYPGISRGILTRTSLYNQEISGGALLVEVGSAGNTHGEALRAAEALAQAIIALSNGVEGK